MGNFIAKAPIRRYMKEVGAYLVADSAVDYLITVLEGFGKEVTKKAIEMVESDKRKRLSADDIAMAAKAL